MGGGLRQGPYWNLHLLWIFHGYVSHNQRVTFAQADFSWLFGGILKNLQIGSTDSIRTRIRTRGRKSSHSQKHQGGGRANRQGDWWPDIGDMLHDISPNGHWTGKMNGHYSSGMTGVVSLFKNDQKWLFNSCPRTVPCPLIYAKLLSCWGWT